MNNDEYIAVEYDPDGEAPCPVCSHSSAIHEYGGDKVLQLKCNEQDCLCLILFNVLEYKDK